MSAETNLWNVSASNYVCLHIAINMRTNNLHVWNNELSCMLVSRQHFLCCCVVLMFTAPPLNRWIDFELITRRILGSQPQGRKACWVGGLAPSCPSFHHSGSQTQKYINIQKHAFTREIVHTQVHTHIHSHTRTTQDSCRKVGVPALAHTVEHTGMCDMQDIAIATEG